MRKTYSLLIVLIVTLGAILLAELPGVSAGPSCALTPAGDVAACN